MPYILHVFYHMLVWAPPICRYACMPHSWVLYCHCAAMSEVSPSSSGNVRMYVHEHVTCHTCHDPSFERMARLRWAESDVGWVVVAVCWEAMAQDTVYSFHCVVAESIGQHVSGILRHGRCCYPRGLEWMTDS